MSSSASGGARQDVGASGPDLGYGNRFGIVHADFDTLERTPKLGAEWFREAARCNARV